MVWLAFAFLTGIAVLSVLWPLARGRAAAVSQETDVDFYKSQLAEIERDLARGLISPEDAESARNEAGRRLLKTSSSEKQETTASTTRVRIAAVLALLVVPGVTLGLYTKIGHPDVPDQPLTSRKAPPAENMEVEQAVAQIETHLAKNPNDGRGYEVVAPVYLRMGRTQDAILAYSNALRLLGESAQRHSALAEALVYAASGIVTADARKSFEQALRLDPKFPMARYYMGLAAEQEGDKAKAADIWSKLADDAPADSPLVASLRKRIAALNPDGKGAAPQGDAAAAIAAMPEGDRQATIRTMVDGLAGRLAKNGNDIEGWLRLVRAYRVLNESEKAKAALGDARRNFASDQPAIQRLDALAKELGLI